MSGSSDDETPGSAGGTDAPDSTDSADTTDSAGDADTPDSAGGAAAARPGDPEPVVVCLDMDGVLVDSERYWHRAQREHILPTAVDGEGPALDETTGMYYGEIYEYLAEHYEPAVDREAFMELYDEAATDIYGERVALLPGVRPFLAELRAEGIPVALVSSSPHEWIAVVRERFGLRFDLVASAAEFDGPGKPEPGIYEAAVSELGGTPERAVVVEDSANGVRAGARSGAYTVAVRAGHNRESDLSPADEVVDVGDWDGDSDERVAAPLYEAVRQSTRTMRASDSGNSGSSG